MVNGSNMSNCPRIIAHRGASRQYPENTIAAFAGAREQGADGIELDIRWTADKTAVIFHDPVVINGNRRQSIHTLKYDQFHSLTQAAGVAAPTLAETLRWGDGQVPFIFDIKDPRREKQLISEVEQFTLPPETVFSSFRLSVVTTLKTQRPGWRTAWIVGDVRWQGLRRKLLSSILARVKRWKIDALHFHHHWITRELVGRCRDEGIDVSAWTVDAPDEIVRVAATGVDGVITDVPAVARRALDGMINGSHHTPSSVT